MTPDGHIEPGVDVWPDPELVSALTEPLSRIDTSKVTPEALADAMSWGTPPPLNPGRLRPYVPPTDSRTWDYPDVLNRALNLLLYAPEVIVNDPTLWLDFEPQGRDETTRVLRSVVDVWDLVEDGSLLMSDMDTHTMWEAPMSKAEGAELGLTDEEFEHFVYQAMALDYWDGRTSPWLLTNEQTQVAESLFQLAATGGVDRRVLQLPKLAALDLPTLRLHTADLVAVRRNSDTFDEWRQHLGSALAQVELLPDSDAWQRDARAIIADDLAPYAARVRAETEKSTALSASVVGMKELTLAGIGSAVGAMADGTAGALAGLGSAAAMAFVGNLSDWVKGRRAAVPNRAVLQLAIVFDDRSIRSPA